jgi:hypothetical protein
MTSNHALKIQVRVLIAQLPNLSYTQALALVLQRQRFVGRDFRSAQDQLCLEQAAAWLRAGGNVIVFGKMGSGRTAAALSVMQKLEGVPRTFVADQLECDMETKDPSYIFNVRDTDSLYFDRRLFSRRVVAFDELRGGDRLGQLKALHSASVPYLVTLHGSNAVDARRNFEDYSSFAPERTLMLETIRISSHERRLWVEPYTTTGSR